jgi:hypothetical protein
MKPEIKKPFGLQIAAKIAAKALKEGNSPASTVLFNLFSLQKDTFFPKDLDESYFNKPNQGANVDKRVIVRILDELKRPQVNVADLLERTVEEGWVAKKNPPAPKQLPVKKFVAKNKKPAVKTAKVEPTIVIKKNKLSV